MYKAEVEFEFSGKLYRVGDKIENPSQRMIEHGMVSKYIEPKVFEPEQPEETEETTEKDDDALDLEEGESLLTEFSSNVEIKILEEDEETTEETVEEKPKRKSRRK